MKTLSEYIKICNKYTKEIDNLYTLYQLRNQGVVKILDEYKNKKSYKGSFFEYIKLRELEEIDNQQKYPWSKVYTAFKLMNDFTVDWKFNKELMINNEWNTIKELMKIIYDSHNGFYLLEDNLEKDKEVRLKVFEAFELSLNKYHIFKIGEIKNIDNNGKVGLYNNMLELQSVSQFLNWIKYQDIKENTFICAYIKHPVHEFKNNFIYFLIYKGVIYSIDNNERRLNIENSAGSRRPDRYIENMLNKVWMPFEVLWDDKTKKLSTKKDLTIYGGFVSNIISMDNVKQHYPETILWIECFIFKILEYINNNNNKILIGLTKESNQLLLPNNIKYKDKFISDYNKRQHITKDFEKYYMDKISTKSIIIKDKNLLPDLVMSQEYVNEIINYKTRIETYQQLQDVIYEEFKENYQRVYNEIKNIVLDKFNNNKEYFFNKAFKDYKYNYTYYFDSFGGWYGKDKKPNYGDKVKANILINNNYNFSLSTFLYYPDGENRYWEYTKYGEQNKTCLCCNKFRMKNIFKLKFIDYNQFIEFFEITEKDIPEEMKLHLNKKLEGYTGNSILDDVDPINSRFFDPWFDEGISEFKLRDNKWTEYHRNNNTKSFSIVIGICGRCLKKINTELYNKYNKTKDL